MKCTPTNDGNGLAFETDSIEGEIRGDGSYHGVWELVDKETGRQVIHPSFSALNLFVLFARHQSMDQPRQMERTIRVGENVLRIDWPASDGHQGEVSARYEVGESHVDLRVTARISGTYEAYELFLSNYFDKALIPHVYLHGSRYGREATDPELTVPMVSDVFKGTVVVFARDPHAARNCVDGRWNRSEYDAPTVQMCPVRYYAFPIAFLADEAKERGFVLMSRPVDCYAISTRYHVEDEADRMTDYSAFDFSLFGDDFLPGNERTVHMRLAVTGLGKDMVEPGKLYQGFLEGTV